MDYAANVWQGTYIILTGGCHDKTNEGRTDVIKYTFSRDPPASEDDVQCEFIEDLKEQRMNHCQLIVKDILFVFFGHGVNRFIYPMSVEYVDLTVPNAKFEQMEIKGYDAKIECPMIFPE